MKKTSLKKLLLICLLFSPNVLTASLFTKNYHYSVDLGFNSSYPMDFDYVTLIDKSGEPVPLYITGDGGPSIWGSGSQASSLLERNPLPNGIKLRWFSHTENQFWEGEYQFDSRLLQQLKKYRVGHPFHYFQTKPKDFMERTYYYIYATPGGLLTIWISGAGEKYLLAQFQANKVDMNWDSFMKREYGYIMSRYNFQPPTREQYIQERLEKIAPPKNGKLATDATPWLRYMQSYPWHLKLNHQVQLKDYETRYTNGERYFTYATTNQALLGSRPIPNTIDLYFVNNQTNKLQRARIKFGSEETGWEEIIKGFEALGNSKPKDQAIELYLSIMLEQNEVEAYLIKGDTKLELLDIKPTLIDLYDEYSPIACINNEPDLQMGEDDLSNDETQSKMYVMKDQNGHPISNFKYRLLREDGKYLYGTTNKNGETQRVRVVLNGHRLNLELYEDYRDSCISADQIPNNLDTYRPNKYKILPS